MNKSLYSGYTLVLATLLGAGCTAPDGGSRSGTGAPAGKADSDSVIVTTAPCWDNMLWQDSGWLGGDGAYSTALNGVDRPGTADSTATLFWFSDTVIGRIVDDSLTDGWAMIHNSVAYLEGGKPDASRIHFYWGKDASGRPAALFTPATPEASDSDYYWLGDGFVDHALDSTLYIFCYRIRPVPRGIYPFEDAGVALIALPKHGRPPYPAQRQLDTPLFIHDTFGGKTSFGVAVLPNTEGARAPAPDGYVYIYGVRDPGKELLVARVPDSAFEDFSRWRFWDGTSWNSDMRQARALAERVSNEMSVSFMADGRVMAVFELDTDAPCVAIQVGSTPWGPFHPRKVIYKTPEIFSGVDYYTYNAKAHPHLSDPGTLLVGYNVNVLNNFFGLIKRHPHLYRSRFIRISY